MSIFSFVKFVAGQMRSWFTFVACYLWRISSLVRVFSRVFVQMSVFANHVLLFGLVWFGCCTRYVSFRFAGHVLTRQESMWTQPPTCYVKQPTNNFSSTIPLPTYNKHKLTLIEATVNYKIINFHFTSNPTRYTTAFPQLFYFSFIIKYYRIITRLITFQWVQLKYRWIF